MSRGRPGLHPLQLVVVVAVANLCLFLYILIHIIQFRAISREIITIELESVTPMVKVVILNTYLLLQTKP